MDSILDAIFPLEANALLPRQRDCLMVISKLATLGQLSGEIGHEIKNSLAVIGLLLHQIDSGMDQGPVDSSIIKKKIKLLMSHASRIEQIIQGMELFLKPDEGPQFRLDPVEVVQDSVALCRPKLKLLGPGFQVHEIPPLKKVNGCKVQISQVLVNLLNNAYDAVQSLPPESEKLIQISVSDPGSCMEIRVVNNGPYIPADMRNLIFHPFFTTKEKGSGTGLGLYISRKIVESHKGTLILDPSSEKTCFVISLPKSD